MPARATRPTTSASPTSSIAAARPSGLAGGLVIDEDQFGTAAQPLRRQFARPPFMVSFDAGPENSATGLTVIALHIDYANTPAERTSEITTRLRDQRLGADPP